MELTTRTKIIVGSVVVVGAFAAGHYTLPAKIVEKEHIVYQDKIVEKKVYVKEQDTKKNVETIKLVTTKPDGTKTVETKTLDKSEIETTQKSLDNKIDDIKSVTDTSKTITNNTSSLLVSAGVKLNANSLNASPAYGLFVNKKLLGPLYLGAFGFTDASFGLSVGISF